MKSILLGLLLIGITVAPASSATEYICEIRCAQASGLEPLPATKILLIQDLANLKVNTGKIRLTEGNPSSFFKGSSYKVPSVYDDGKATQFKTIRLGLEANITLVKTHENSAELKLELNMVYLDQSIIYGDQKNQVIVPMFHRYGLGPSHIEQVIGQGWFFLTHHWNEKEPNQIWAIRVDKK